jgi:N-acetylglucosamine kinase-like BadF-type ATPase
MFILAADQGGTKTDVVIADYDGNILGYGDDRGCAWGSGERRALRMARLQYAAERASADAGVALTEIGCVSAGLIGADWPFEYALGERNIRNALGITDVTLYNDCIGAMRGGTEMSNRDCAILCLGTGANCALQNRAGERFVYAYYMKDGHQGGYAIGRFVFQAAFDAKAGLAPETALTGLLLEKTGYAAIDELFMHMTTGRTESEPKWYPNFPEYAPLLFTAIRTGDVAAENYLNTLCGELVNYITAGAKKLRMENRPLTVVLSGGVPKGGAVMRERLERHLRAALPDAVCVDAIYEPVIGALLLGYDRTYPECIPAAVRERLNACCRERGLFRHGNDV